MSTTSAVREAATSVPLFIPEISIESQRSSGYADTLTAVNEFVDNSVEAGAKEVRVYYLPRRKDNRLVSHDIVVLDNGSGMEPPALQKALAFGGGDRFDRRGIGRFAYGMPNAAISQGQTLEVYSWQRPNEVYKATLDVPAVKEGRQKGIDEPELEDVPPELKRELFKPVGTFPDSSEQQENLLTGDNWPAHGTLIHISNCDQLTWKQTKPFVEHSWTLGRIYRYFMWLKGIRIYVNNRLIQSVDPLYLNPKARHSGSTPHGPPIQIEIPLWDPALADKPEDKENVPTAAVEVRLSRLPVTWMADEMKVNKNQRKVYEHTQMSVLRAERELELAFKKLFGRSEEDQDNWWGGEIHVPPQLDEPFGVMNNKQGTHPKQYVKDILFDALWPTICQLRKDIQAERREERQKRKGGEPTFLEKRMAEAEKLLSVVREIPADESYQQQVEEELRRFAAEHRRQGENAEQAYDRVKSSPYIVEFESTPEGPFYRVETYGTQIVLFVNRRHQFYEKIWEPLSSAAGNSNGNSEGAKAIVGGDSPQDALAMLLASIARVELEFKGKPYGEEWFQEVRQRWSANLRTFLGMLR